MGDSLVYRLRKRAEIRRGAMNRKSVQEGKPDRISDLLEEAADRLSNKWIRVEDSVPELYDSDFCGKQSNPVLGLSLCGAILVVTCEKYDEDSTPKWFSNCSEHWQLSGLSYWMPLPDVPQKEE